METSNYTSSDKSELTIDSGYTTDELCALALLDEEIVPDLVSPFRSWTDNFVCGLGTFSREQVVNDLSNATTNQTVPFTFNPDDAHVQELRHLLSKDGDKPGERRMKWLKEWSDTQPLTIEYQGVTMSNGISGTPGSIGSLKFVINGTPEPSEITPIIADNLV